jgi:antitoxin CptB
MTAPLATQDLNRLKWRCRRGLLENDLLIEDFFARQQGTLDRRQAGAMAALMELPDNDLLDLLLRRGEPQGGLDRPEVHELLVLMRRPAKNLTTEGAAP